MAYLADDTTQRGSLVDEPWRIWPIFFFQAQSALKTEEQIFAEFREVEDVELVLELENKEEQEREKEASAKELVELNPRSTIPSKVA
jgi:hypothetical protein